MDAPHLEAHVHRNSLGEQVWCVDDADEPADKMAWIELDCAVKERAAYACPPPKGLTVNLVV